MNEQRGYALDAKRIDQLEELTSIEILRVRENECAGDFIHIAALRSGLPVTGYGKTLRDAIDALAGISKESQKEAKS